MTSTLNRPSSTISTSPPSTSRAVKVAQFWLIGFVLFQVACQLALLVEAIGALRVLVRSASFLAGLTLLLCVPGRSVKHPAQGWCGAVMVFVAVGILFPTTNSLLVGVAQILLYLAILGPIFWVPRLTVTPAVLDRFLMTLWGFYTLSASVGVLQMYYPGQFQPSVSTAIQGMGEMADAYKITLANGATVWRPMGLTDSPGGAAGAGMFAALFGLGFLLRTRRPWVRLAAGAGMIVGLFCIYLSQVRSLLVMTVVSCGMFTAILLWRGEVNKVFGATGMILGTVLGSLLWAVSIGGQSTLDRFNTLMDGSPTEVYGRNRGVFLTETFTQLIFDYPFGAGLGRWGMMRGYFGDADAPHSPMIWVEIQWTGWLLDGGIALMVAYTGAILAVTWIALRIALSRLPGGVPLWGALVVAYDLGAIAVTFNYPLFIGQGGVEFWLLNACVYTGAYSAWRVQKAELIRRGLP